MNCYALTQCTFSLHRRLSDHEYDRLIDVPGVEPWHPYGRREMIHAPYSAAFIVARILTRLSVPFTFNAADVNALADFADPDVGAAWSAHVAHLAKSNGLYPWVADKFALPFQLLCAAFACNRGRSTIHAEPGSGKTVIAIVAAVAFNRPVLWITRSGAVDQHTKEWKRFCDWHVLERRPPSRRKVGEPGLADFVANAGQHCAVLVGWDMLTTWRAELADFVRRGWTVVFDEAHLAKSAKRLKWQVGEDADGRGTDKVQAVDIENTSAAAFQIACAASQVICTTATPVANALIDLWGQLTLVEPHAWGKTDSRFARYHCDAHKGEYGWVKKGVSREHLDDLAARMSFSTIRIPYATSHGQLPPKRRMVIRVSADDQVNENAGYGKEMRRLQKDADKGDEAAAGNVARLHLARAASRKRAYVAATLREYLTSGKGKLVVFTGWREDCEYLGKQVTRGAGDLKVWVSHGADNVEVREQIREDFMAHPGPCVLVGTWQAWGESLNLSDADVIAFAMLPYTPREVAQGEGRGDRLGMTRPLLYLYFVADGTIDESVAHVLASKMEAVDAVTDGNRLGAFGGLRDTLVSADDESAGQVVQRALGRLEADDTLDAGWTE